MSRDIQNKNENECTLHIPLTLIHNKGITPTAVFLVPDNSYPFNGTKGLKLASQVVFSRIFVLWLRNQNKLILIEDTLTKREMKRVLYGSPMASESSAGLSRAV